MYFGCYADHKQTELWAIEDHTGPYNRYGYRDNRTNKAYFRKISVISWYLTLAANFNNFALLNRLSSVDYNNMSLFLLLIA